MRTIYLNELHKTLSTIDKNLTNELFIYSQFLLDNAEHIKDQSNNMTGDFYTKNFYKKQFNYRLKDIPGELEKVRQFAMTSSFIFSYSAYEIYIEELYALTKRIIEKNDESFENEDDDEDYIDDEDDDDTNDEDTDDEKNNDEKQKKQKKKKSQKLDLLFTYLGSSTKKKLETHGALTVKYIRLRRNCLVHRDGKISKSLQKITLNRAEKLKQFWFDLHLSEFDFSSSNINHFSFEESIDLFRLIKELTSRIDSAVLDLIGQQKILRFALNDFKSRHKEAEAQSPKKMQDRFLREINFKFGIDSKSIDLNSIPLMKL